MFRSGVAYGRPGLNLELEGVDGASTKMDWVDDGGDHGGSIRRFGRPSMPESLGRIYD